MVYLTVSCPDPKFFPPYPEYNTTDAPQRDQAHVRHDWRHISLLDNPSIDDFGESVTPKVLVDCNAYKYGTGNGLVGVDCVSRGDGRESCDLNASTCPANYYDRLKV